VAHGQPRPYEANPRYMPAGGAVRTGWAAAAATLPTRSAVLALDGPAVLDWTAATAGLSGALAERGMPVRLVDVRQHLVPWQEVLDRTASGELVDDPDFATLASGSLADLFDDLPVIDAPAEGVCVVFGPGAALVGHDRLWYVDLPKRYAEAAVTSGVGRNLGQRDTDGVGGTKRLFYIDWPLLDRHRDTIATGIDLWIDLQNPRRPMSIDGDTLRRTMQTLARQPFRTRPTFNTTPWGGHWAQRRLGINSSADNTALGYELIAPESGVLIGADATAEVELPFALVVALHPGQMLGKQVYDTFGCSFPIRFDYLDTVDGGNLSVHCHPQADYMRKIFGWPYTQHETYYVMVGGADRKIYLGLREDVDVDQFRREARAADQRGEPFDIERHVRTFPAEPHQLFLIPAGTPHGSGEGNVVLEVSATPYLYSLRFYDWLRRDAKGRQRPVHVDHAFNNLNRDRAGRAVADDLVQRPHVLREGAGWCEELLGRLPEMFFDVRRVTIESDTPVDNDTGGRFQVINLVQGDGAELRTRSGYRHALAYAETLVIPAAVGEYTLSRIGREPVRLVRAQVR